MKTSKVKWTQSNGTFRDMNITEVEFENGDCGNNYHKSDKTKFEVGKTFQYEIGGTGKTPNVKFISAVDESGAQGSTQGNTKATAETPQAKQWGKSPEESNRIARMNALTNAVNMVIGSKENSNAHKHLSMENVLLIAQEFEKFICHGMNGTDTAMEINKTNAGVPTSVPQLPNPNDDLPF